MPSKKTRKLIYELSQNSRIRTKDLGKKIGASQQSASYLIASLKQKKIILEHNVRIDPSKLGLINILIYYNFTDFSAKNIHEIISFLKNEDSVVNIEQLSQGYDLSCVFCVPNLSNFNKMNKDFLHKFKNKIYAAEIFPIIVKHLYSKNYLWPHRQAEELIVGGDRDIINMSENEKKIIRMLQENPTIKILDMAKKLKLNPKTITKLKANLEKNKIIRGYSTLWDYKLLKIIRKQILVNSEELDLNEDKKLLEFAKNHPNVTALSRLIGKYDLLFEVEGESISNRDVLKELRSEFGIKDFEVVGGGTILKAKYVPLSALD
ncbi:MAG: Lrp/AsnC family transcriptional regulator [Nanoarchaeota archaeon]|nr:Lrp/AsnC family transcriptional regulator [Nanoarchaeota archaeon]